MFLEAVPAADPLSFVQYGVLGVILMMLLTGWLWPKPAVEGIQKTLDTERIRHVEELTAIRARHTEERKFWVDSLLKAMKDLNEGVLDNNSEIKQASNELAEIIRILEEERYRKP